MILGAGIQADSINKTQVPDQLVEFDMWTNDNTLETKVDSPVDSSILDGAKDTKKGNHWALLFIYFFEFYMRNNNKEIKRAKRVYGN